MSSSLSRTSDVDTSAVEIEKDDVTGRTILFVIPWDVEALGGVNQVVVNLIRQTRRSDSFKGVLVENLWKNRQPSAVASSGVPIVRMRLLSPCSSSHPLRAALRFLGELPASLYRLRRTLRKNRVAMVNVHYPSPAALHFYILRMLRLYRGKIVLSVHGQDVAGAARSKGFSRACWRSLFRLADRIVACSGALAGEVVAFDAELSGRVVVIHNGVDEQVMKDSRDASFVLPELDDTPYILNIATFEQKKGQDVLVDAFRRLASEFPQHRLVLVGRSGETVDGLKRQISQYGLDDKVYVYEDVPHKHVAAFLENASLFCLPSRIEPFGIVLLEAGLFNIPIVATRVGGVPEIIEDGLHGRLVEAEDSEALAASMHASLSDPETSARYADTFRRRVVEEFTWDKAFSRYVALIDNQ